MIYYVKRGQSSIFNKIIIKDNGCKISKIPSNDKNIEKVVKKMKKKKIEEIVLSKELKQNKKLIQILKNYDITILDGKWLMQYMLKNIIHYYEKCKKIPKFDEITILVNDLTEQARENIKQCANNYKKLRIITNHYERFQKLEKELYEKKGISIIITNNKRKAMSKSKLIINLDFVEEIVNKYNIYENAVIINFSDKIKINKKRFSGVIISDYEVKIDNTNEKILDLGNKVINPKEFSLKEIFEELVYSQFQKMPNYNRFETIQKLIKKLIKKYNIEIKELYGINGVIK